MLRFFMRRGGTLFSYQVFSALFAPTASSSLLRSYIQQKPSAFLNKHVSSETRVTTSFASGSIRTFASSFGRTDPWWKSNHQRKQAANDHDSAASDDRVTLESIAENLKSEKYNRILVVTGAGVSCAAGIPDFRTPGTGLYDNLHKFEVPYAEAIFELDFYRRKPEPFVTLAKEMWPGINYRPTLTHCFLRLLDEKGILQRIYTQNIDGLEVIAGVPPEKMVECHGHFRSASCTKCQTPYDGEKCKTTIVEEGRAPICEHCNGLVKPDIVFFGEELPDRFSRMIDADTASADLLIVIGTSLLVAPVACIPSWFPSTFPRLLMNRELVGDFSLGRNADLFLEGDCDDSVRKLCQRVGWEKEVDNIYSEVG